MNYLSRTMDRMLDRLVRKDSAVAACESKCEQVNENCLRCVQFDCSVTLHCGPR